MRNDNDGLRSGANGISDAGPVHAKLKELLISHAIRPNEHLSIRILAEKFGASTTRVREALIRLAVEGMIVHHPKGGFYTRPLVLQELKDAYQLGFVLFKHCIESGIGGFDITELNKPMELEFDREGRVINVTTEFAKTHFMFVEALYRHLAELSGNRCIVNVVKNFNLVTGYVRELDLADPERVPEIARDMMELTGFLQGRRADAAVANLRRQFEKKLDRLPDLVKEANFRDLQARPLGRH